MKTSKTSYIVTAVLFVVYNLLAFVIPSGKTLAFWIAYAFGIISFGVMIFTWKRAIDSGKDIMSRYYKIPLLRIGLGYVILSAVLMMLFKFIPDAPIWVPLLICALLLCAVFIGLITSDSAVETGLQEVERIEKNISTKRAFIKDLQIEVEMLAETESDPEIKSMLTDLAKKIRLSDPMSDDSLSSLEAKLSEKLAEIENSSCKAEIIKEAEMLLLKRNKKVKALKG